MVNVKPASSMSDLHELFFKIGMNVRGIKRFRWQALIFAWCMCVGGWAMVIFMPDMYQSTAKVHVDTQSVLRPLLKGLTVQTDVLNTASIINRALLSRPNLETVAHATNLSARAKDDRGFDLLLEDLRRKIELKAANQKDIYTITYKDVDPQMTEKVVTTLLTGFVERTLGNRDSDTDAAQRFLDQQIAEYQVRLEESEAKLKEFKRKNIGLMPSDGKNYYQRMEVANSQLQDAKLKLREAEFRAEELRGQIVGEVPTFGFSAPKQATVTSPELRAIEARLKQRRTELESMMLNFTDQHPDVIALKFTIASIEREREAAAVAQMPAAALSGDPTKENPVYQQMKISLSRAEAEVATLKVRVREYQGRVNRLKKRVDTIPAIEADMQKLSRDYNVIKQNYESLLKRRESARISGDVERSTDEVQFKIIDPPRVPLVPIGPNRPLFMGAVLGIGAAAGIALALMLSLIKPVYYTVRDLTLLTGHPVLGGVSRVSTIADKVSERLQQFVFLICSVSLVAAYSGLVTLQGMGVNINERLQTLIGAFV